MEGSRDGEELLRFQSIMPPVLQRLIAVTVRVLFRLFFLREMALVIGSHASHVLKILIIVFGRIFLGILLQDLDYLAATSHGCQSIHDPEAERRAMVQLPCWSSPLVSNRFARPIILRPARLLRAASFEPFLKLLCCHIDCFVKVPKFVSYWTYRLFCQHTQSHLCHF